MKIAWNSVTWYSKLIALILFIALPFIGFWLGTQYGAASARLASQQPVATSSTPTPYYSDVAEWQTDSRQDGGFSIAYPIDFQADDNYSAKPSMDWRLDASGTPGEKMLTITIPKIFEPQTNFSDATLTVGKSANAAALADCLQPDQSGGPAGANPATSTVNINGAAFWVFKFASAGAGNYYETTSYRTIHAGACYAVEYTIHSNQIANYPASYNLQPFDEAMVSDVLSRMVGTFNFS